MKDITITSPKGVYLCEVTVSVEPLNWLTRFLWRWLKHGDVKVTWAEIPSELVEKK